MNYYVLHLINEEKSKIQRRKIIKLAVEALLTRFFPQHLRAVPFRCCSDKLGVIVDVVVLMLRCSAEEHCGERAPWNVAHLQIHEAGAQGEGRQSSHTPAQVSTSHTQVSTAAVVHKNVA